jgi:hypothetical protein
MPVSKVSAGFQPSSRSILRALDDRSHEVLTKDSAKTSLGHL